jgi:hypothetical protein
VQIDITRAQVSGLVGKKEKVSVVFHVEKMNISYSLFSKQKESKVRSRIFG